MCSSDRVRRWVRPAALVAYVALLHWTYTSFVAPTFGDLNMGYRTPVLWSYALLSAGVVGLGLLQPDRIAKPSDVVLWLYFLLATAPTALIAQITPFLSRAVWPFASAWRSSWPGWACCCS